MTRSPPYKWLDRNISVPCPHYVLCTTQEMFNQVSTELGWELSDWLEKDSYATVHDGIWDKERTCVVCVKAGMKQAEAMGVLTHEATHIWQAYMKEIGEDTPSSEFMAYGIQSLTKNLWQEYQRQKRARKR